MPEQSARERVARAICASDGIDPDSETLFRDTVVAYWRVYVPAAEAALTVARAHFAALSRQHGAAIRGRIDMGDGPATVERFEQRALVAHEIATLIEGKST